MKIKKVIDISRTLYPEMAVWEGDKHFKLNRNLAISSGSPVNLSSLEMSVHTGTHVDAPLHFIDEGLDIESLDLTRFLSFVKVFELKVEKCITEKDLLSLDIREGDSIILKTSNSYLPENEPISDKYIYLDFSAANYLVSKKIRTIGIDHLSADSTSSMEFPVHKLLLSSNVGIIEGLRLSEVEEGSYLMSALPLKIKNSDGAPTRAVLIVLE